MKLPTALIQTTSVSDITANIAAIEPMVREAAAKGAQFISLPENAFYMRAQGEEGAKGCSVDVHAGVKAMRALAKELNVWVLVGSVIVAVPGEKRCNNRSLLIDGKGNIAAAYDKIHLFDAEVGDKQTYHESAHILPGGKAVLADTPWGKLGLTVCYDLRFPQLYRSLAKAGASIIAVPSAFTATTGEAHWHVLLRSRAIETGCFVIAAAQCGTHPGGRKTFGHSLVVDPWGRVLADGGPGPCVVMATLDLEEVEKVRKKLPSLHHDRAFNL